MIDPFVIKQSSKAVPKCCNVKFPFMWNAFVGTWNKILDYHVNLSYSIIVICIKKFY